ncbi:MAG: hypothetical protein AMK73_00560 [Planctomycetes bacterium SM23_32]|nr:MAG: hypothetical protein AMK73_00560 [Planctomycetes bacterium SM23_32]
MWLLIVCLGSVCPASAAPEDWWDAHWGYRLVVNVVGPERRAGINSALLNLAEQSQLCLPDGRDVRVVTAGGRSVPHRVEIRDNKTLDVLFQVAGGDTRFHVYYGNAEAEAAERRWEESLGGLFLETRPIDRPLHRPSDLRQAERRYRARFDRKPWGRIWDLENPFGRDDLYLSIYEGTLYCPESGDYQFAVNADDVAYFGIQGLADPLCWRGEGVPSMSWYDPNNPRAVRELAVEKGVYHIRYYHGENWGQQLAKLGWRTPSSDAIVTVPAAAFVTYLPVEIAARQALNCDICPFFVSRHEYTLRVNGREPGFPRYRFEARVANATESDGWQFAWDFGDGEPLVGAVVEHEFAGAQTHQVALKVTAPDGTEASILRPVTPPAGPVRDVTVSLSVGSDVHMLGPGSPLLLRTLVVVHGGLQSDFELVTQSGSHQDAVTQPLKFAPHPSGDGSELAFVRQSYVAAPDDMQVKVAVAHRGVEAVSERLRVLQTDGPLSGLHLDEAQDLRDQEGRLVVLRLADLRRDNAPPRRLCETRTGAVSILAFDEMLAGPPGHFQRAEYGEALRRMLAARYSELDFRFDRVARGLGSEPSPLDRFLRIRDAMGRAEPNLVLLVCQPQSVINGVPVGDFEGFLAASLDHVLARSRAEVVIVAPPPVPGAPEAARPYARAAKRVGLRKGVAVVDLYSRFLLTADWEGFFRPRGARRPSYMLYPNEAGQALIAQEVYTAVVGACHADLSAAVREVSLLRTGGAGR